jgi:hypothetical protein
LSLFFSLSLPSPPPSPSIFSPPPSPIYHLSRHHHHHQCGIGGAVMDDRSRWGRVWRGGGR